MKAFEPESEPYYLCYSGGKDSDCIRILAELSGVNYEIHHNLTTVDAPETIRYIRTIPGVIIERPPLTMSQLIVKKKFPPTRLKRYCCEYLKERGGKGRLKITGVRWSESPNRKANHGKATVARKSKTIQQLAEAESANIQLTAKGGVVLNDDNAESRRFVGHCYRTASTMINPIVDWMDEDVWEFLHYYGCQSNPLYQCGEKRIGCIGCPLQGFKGQKEDFVKYPGYRKMYVRAFDKMLEARNEAGLITNNWWQDGEHVMRWWVGDDPSQITISDCFPGIDVDEP